MIIFILKSVGLSVIISALIGGITGFIIDKVKVAHPHQMIPNSILGTIIGALVGLVISLITSIVMCIGNNQNFLILNLINAIITFITFLILAIFVLKK